MVRTRTPLTSFARSQRKSGNAGEAALWLVLRNRNLNGHKFRRQVPIDRYIADFACHDLNLIVEVDGSQHSDVNRDVARDQVMNAQGWSVARFWFADILNSREAVVETIAAIADGRLTEKVESHEFQFYPAPMTPESFMRRAIALARPGKTWPNPSVGCVLVKDGVVIAEGTTGDGGRPHAEEVALDAAGEVAQGATAYVTLEPCGHRSLPRPSCSERLIAASVAEVIYACADPSPQASDIGPQRMHDAGIVVRGGLLADEAEHLIAPSRYYFRTGRPLVRTAANGDGFDAEFTAGTDTDLAAELTDWAAKGYRSLWVEEGSDMATRLRAQGLLTE